MKQQDFSKCAKDLLDWIGECPSPFHVIDRAAKDYEKAGFERLCENKPFTLSCGGSYCVTRGDSALIAFRLPKNLKAIKGFHMAAAHCDSPTFQVKENPERSVERYVTLNVEKYGGMICSTWLDRPLSIAGRIAVEEENGEIGSRLVNIDQDLLVIPNLAIHMNREINRGFEYNPQVDLQPLFFTKEESNSSKTAEKQKDAFLKLVAKSAGVKPEQILGHDLVLYVRDHGRFVGPDAEMILSPRLDDLQCVYSMTRAHMAEKPSDYITVGAMLNNEEVGSRSAQGADSTLLEDILMRIGDALKVDTDTVRSWIANGMMISADNAHAVHPCHPEKADPTNRPYLNGGIVIKYNSEQKYITNGMMAAKIKQLCKKADVPCQIYVNRSDVPGGSTLGNISAAHVSVPGADIGLPQLAMHSAVETAGTKDTLYGIAMFREYFSE